MIAVAGDPMTAWADYVAREYNPATIVNLWFTIDGRP